MLIAQAPGTSDLAEYLLYLIHSDALMNNLSTPVYLGRKKLVTDGSDEYAGIKGNIWCSINILFISVPAMQWGKEISP